MGTIANRISCHWQLRHTHTAFPLKTSTSSRLGETSHMLWHSNVQITFCDIFPCSCILCVNKIWWVQYPFTCVLRNPSDSSRNLVLSTWSKFSQYVFYAFTPTSILLVLIHYIWWPHVTVDQNRHSYTFPYISLKRCECQLLLKSFYPSEEEMKRIKLGRQ